VDISVDAVSIPGPSLTGQDLARSPAARLQLGETTTGRTYDIVVEHVTVAPTLG
jgi:hypothetical protein